MPCISRIIRILRFNYNDLNAKWTEMNYIEYGYKETII